VLRRHDSYFAKTKSHVNAGGYNYIILIGHAFVKLFLMQGDCIWLGLPQSPCFLMRQAYQMLFRFCTDAGAITGCAALGIALSATSH
jgi:hypothetical protein